MQIPDLVNTDVRLVMLLESFTAAVVKPQNTSPAGLTRVHYCEVWL